MAYERVSDAKVKGDSLEAFVQNLNTLFKRQVAIRNADDELKFNTAVLEDNLTLEDQLDYRKEQLKRVSDDPEERRRVRSEISNLKQRIEQETFTDSYAEKVTDFQSGLISIDSVIQFLKDQKASTSNQSVLNAIEQKLGEAESTKFKLTQDLIKNTSEYATNSKSVSTIDDQIKKVQSYRTKASLSGNDQLVSVYDLQLQSLNQAKSSVEVQNDLLNIGAVSATGQYSATALLDAMNAKISSVGASGPIRVGDTTYASAKDFWTYKRDAYLSDSGSGGFFSQLNTELKNKTALLQSKNLLDTTGVKSLAATFDSVAARPELANYQKQIDIYKQDVLQDGANKLVDTITNEFARTLDVNKAVTSITNLKGLGVNVDDAFTKILTSNAATKNAQVQGILGAAQVAMQNDPNLTPEAAIAQAVGAGAGTVVSPEEAAGKSEKEIATKAVTTAAAGAATPDPRTTVQPGQTPNTAPTEPANTPQPSGNLNFSTIANLPNLTPGMRSEDVRTLQNFLIQQGFNIQDGATGFYGPQTQAAVTAFQEKNKIDTAGNPGYFGSRTKSFLGGNQPATPAPAPTATATPAQPTPQPAAPTAQPSAAATPGATSYLTDPDYLKVKQGAGASGKYGRTPGGIVDLTTGKILA